MLIYTVWISFFSEAALYREVFLECAWCFKDKFQLESAAVNRLIDYNSIKLKVIEYCIFTLSLNLFHSYLPLGLSTSKSTNAVVHLRPQLDGQEHPDCRRPLW